MVMEVYNKIDSLLESCADEGDSSEGRDKNLRGVILSIGDMCQQLKEQADSIKANLTPAFFSQWLARVHDYLLRRDAGLRSVLLRVIRLSLPLLSSSPSLNVAESNLQAQCPFCALIVSKQIHLIAINSLEKEHNGNWERMQALKLMQRMLHVSPISFPMAFARSLVAITQHVPDASESSASKQIQDPCKNICIEILRELALANVEVAYKSEALKVIFDIILSETSQDLVEPLLMTILFLLNKPNTRRFIRPYLDLQWLLAPFTDLDSQPAAVLKGNVSGGGGREELNPAAKKLQAAKFAFVTIMKSWGGVIALTSSDTGLLSIVRLLSDPDVSNVVKETILDCISEICEPVVTKLEFNKSNAVKNVSLSNPSAASTPSSTSIIKDSKSKRGIFSEEKVEGENIGLFQGDGGSQNRSVRSSTNPEVLLNAQSGQSSFRKSRLSFKKHRRSSLQISNIVNHERQKVRAEDEMERVESLDILDSPTERSWKHMLQGGNSSDMTRSRKDSFGKPLSVWTRFTSHAELAEKFSVDPIYNMLDNYAGVLCCAFMHVKLFDALCWLGTNGDDAISARGKDILVDLMGVVNKICTEKICSEILTLPSLIEYAANSANVKKRNHRAYKASDVLRSLSNAFSVSKRKEINIYSANSGHSGNKSNSLCSYKIMGRKGQTENWRRSYVVTNNSSGGRGRGRPLSSVTEEMLHMSSGLGGSAGGGSRNNKSALAFELKMFLSDSTLDKSEFSKQMDSSRVLGKDGKEPFRWDWAVIGDMLDYSFAHTQDRLVEALKTKWVKRVSGFFRCAVEEKGYFANLEWEPGHLQYFDCGCQLYKILTTQEPGYSFINSDRRGMLFPEIVRDLEAVFSQCVSGNSLSSKNLNVFRMAGCQQTMAREYFALIGRSSASPFCKKLLTKSHLYDTLVQTGSHVELDYLSRNVLTSLSFTDGGFISKDLMQIYLTSGTSSTNLRLYSHSLLRALLRSRSAEVCEWGIEVMVQQMMFLHVPRKLIVHCMEEAAQDRVYLGQLIRIEPDLEGEDMANISIRFLALPEGFEYLTRLGWIEPELKRWQERKCRQYSAHVEVGLAKALNRTYLRRQLSQLVAPIPLQVPAFSEHPSAPHGLRYPDGGVDLEGLLRLPLNIEAKVNSTSVSAVSKEDCRFLRIDSYLDTSELRCPASNEMTSDTLRTVKVRGIVLNAKGEPSGFPVQNDRDILSCLLCGSCPVSKDGRVGHSASLLKQKTEKTNTESYSAAESSNVTSASVTKSSNMSVQARRQSVVSVDADKFKDRSDVPVSAINSFLFDWSTCKPKHRTLPRRLPVSGDPDKYAVEIPGEPAVFIFSTKPPPGAGESASSAVAFLVEIHYVLSLKTGQSAFLPLPRHMYGEMARTVQGRQLLMDRQIVSTLLHYVEKYEADISMYVPSSPITSNARNSLTSSPEQGVIGSVVGNSTPPATSDVISSLWALGHIAAVEEGFQIILDVSPHFVPTCIALATDAMSYSVRSCAFSVLGLISRTESGSGQLAVNDWEASPIHYVAVAMPDNPSVLFRCQGDLDSELDAIDALVSSTNSKFSRESKILDQVPFSIDELKSTVFEQRRPVLSVESKLLEAIGRLPGQLLYKENMARIKDIKKHHAEVFNSRSVYLSVHQLLENYSFKLSIRRYLLSLFNIPAKKQGEY